MVAKGAEASDANLWKSTKLEGCTLGFQRSANMKQARTDKEQDMPLGSDFANMSKHYALM